jgi:biopolymer transport protein ExbD
MLSDKTINITPLLDYMLLITIAIYSMSEKKSDKIFVNALLKTKWFKSLENKYIKQV